jgi:CheY-like chemotaxis protein
MDNKEVEVLLIEDSQDDAELMIRALGAKLGNKITHLKDGQEAVDFFFGSERNQSLPSLILLDLKLPKVNGIEVLQQLKSNPATKKIPVVIMTSSKENQDLQRCYELGANSYVVKPTDFRAFVEATEGVGLYWILINEKL